MKYTEEEVGNIIKAVELFTGKKVANYTYVSYPYIVLDTMGNGGDFVIANQVLYGTWEVGHVANNVPFLLEYQDNYGNALPVVSYLGKSDNIGTIEEVIFNYYNLGGASASFNGILFNLVDVPAPAFRFSFEKTNVASTVVGFGVDTYYGVAEKLGKVFVDFGDGAGIVTFDKDTEGLQNPSGIIAVKYQYTKPGRYTIKVYTEFEVNTIHITDEYYNIMGAANFVLSNGVSFNITTFESNYQDALYSTIDFITGNASNFNQATTVNFIGNRLTTAQVNAILVHFNNQGATGKTYILNAQTPLAPPSGAGITAKAALIARGCIVYTD